MTARCLPAALLVAALLAVAEPAAAAPAEPPVPPRAAVPDDLAALVAEALRAHPALAAARADSQAAAAAVDAAGSLPDPRLSWGEMLEPVETRVGPQQRVLGVQQQLPWPGTLGARRDAATAGTRAAAAARRAQAVQIAAAVRRAWAQAAWLAESRAVVDAQRELARQLESSARAAYEAGEGTYADLLQAQVEVARLDDRRRDLDDRLDAAMAHLTAAVGRDSDAPVAVPAGLPAAAGAAAASGLSAAAPPDGHADAPATTHPLLAVQDARADAAGAEARAARRTGLPSISLGLDWIQVGDARRDGVDGSGQDAVVGKLGLTLPIWRGKSDGRAAAAEARARAAAATRRAAAQDLSARRAAAAADLARARRTRDLHARDLVPRARQALAAMDAAYQSGQASLVEVVTAQRTLLDLQLTLLAARRDLLIAAADRDAALGVVPGRADRSAHQK
jgi:outer membrane protein TolC